MPEETERAAGPQVWIFQGNPAKYRLEDSLRIEPEEFWNVRQHAARVRVGDTVLVWLSGEEAGIYAVGEVLEDPAVRPDSPQGQGYWRDPRDGQREYPRVRVRYTQTLLDRPLSKPLLVTDPALEDLSIFRNPRGTNFPVTAKEWAALQVWLDPAGPD